MNTKAVFAGTFDPFTVGHREIARRAAALFPGVTILVAADEKNTMFSCSTRIAVIEASVRDMKNVSVQGFTGLLTDEMKRMGANVLVRGLRNAADFDYERNLCSVYKSLLDVECLYLFSDPALNHMSSTFVRELIRYRGSLTGYLAPEAIDIVEKERPAR